MVDINPKYVYKCISTQAFQVVPGTFTHLKWYLVSPDFKEYCKRYS